MPFLVAAGCHYSSILEVVVPFFEEICELCPSSLFDGNICTASNLFLHISYLKLHIFSFNKATILILGFMKERFS